MARRRQMKRALFWTQWRNQHNGKKETAQGAIHSNQTKQPSSIQLILRIWCLLWNQGTVWKSMVAGKNAMSFNQ
jgi:hypothetical protein